MAYGKYLSLEEARKLGKLKEFAKQHKTAFLGGKMTARKILSWLKARYLAEIALGFAIGFLTAGALFTTIQVQIGNAMNDRAIEAAQYQIADALSEAHKFRNSIDCTMTTPTGCRRWEPRPSDDCS